MDANAHVDADAMDANANVDADAMDANAHVDAVEEAPIDYNNADVEVEVNADVNAGVEEVNADTGNHDDVMADIDAAAENAANVAIDMVDGNQTNADGNQTNADDTNNFEGGSEDSFEAAPKKRGEKMRLYFRRDHRCELDLPYNMDTVSYIYVDVDFDFVRTASKQFTKYEPLLKGKKEDEVTNKD